MMKKDGYRVERTGDYQFEIPTTEKEGMRVPAQIYASDKLFKEMDLGVLNQITNVACLPGIVRAALCMPDGHWGYGFPIGGVAAFDKEEGVISPGGIGFDINCGMRLLTTNMTFEDVKPRLEELVENLFRKVPAGLGGTGFLRLSASEFRDVVERGVGWCIENGYGWEEDRERIEDFGCIEGADSAKVSSKAISRGLKQLGTLGSGNHYLEIQLVTADNIYDKDVAERLGFNMDNQVVIMFHCGSRGFGHQVATDYLRVFERAARKYGITVRDRELACAPFNSPEGQDYYKAMACAANNAFANRQVITHMLRKAVSETFKTSPEDLGLHVVYDVCHNIAKVEKYRVDGEERELVIHRKGATRSLGPGAQQIPPMYRDIGQPVIIGGSMETGSYVLMGTKKAEEKTFGSTAHGSGRTMSRTKAKRLVRGDRLLRKLKQRGIYIRAASMSGLAEEAGFAYKNISEVVDVVHQAGISRKIVGLRPIGNIKG